MSGRSSLGQSIRVGVAALLLAASVVSPTASGTTDGEPTVPDAAAPSAQAPSPSATPTAGLVPDPASAATAPPAGPGLTIDSITPAELVPGGTVRVSGRVVAEAGGWEDVTVAVRRTLRRTATVSALDQWTGDTDDGDRPDDPSTTAVVETVIGAVPSGPGTAFSVDVVADEVGLSDDLRVAGPYGLELSLQVAGEEVDAERGFLLWSPETTALPSRLVGVLPLVGPVPDLLTGLAPPAELRELTAEGGELRRRLELGLALEVDWAVDPALLAGLVAARAADPAGPEASWLAALAQGRGDREVVLLDWAVPSAAKLAGAVDPVGARTVVEDVRQEVLPPEELEQLLAGPVREDVFVATSQGTDLATLGLLLDGRTDVVLAEQAVPLLDDLALTYTEDAVTVLAGPDEPLTAVLAGSEVTEHAVAAAGGDPLATTRLLARLATTTLQRPNDPRLVALLFPDDVVATPGGTQALATALGRTGWASGVGLSQALVTAPATQPRAGLPDGRRPPPDQGVRRALQALLAYSSVSSAFAAPDPLMAAPAQRRVAAGLSSLTGVDAPAQVAGVLEAEAARVVDGVRLVQGSRVTLAAEQAAMPFTVVNDLDRPVELLLDVRSTSPRLRILAAPQAVVLQPGVRTVVEIDVEAVASGPAEVTAQLRTTDGRSWGPGGTSTVRVAIQAEARVLGVLAAAVGVLFVGGSVRAFRVNRRRRALDHELVPSTVPGTGGGTP